MRPSIGENPRVVPRENSARAALADRSQPLLSVSDFLVPECPPISLEKAANRHRLEPDVAPAQLAGDAERPKTCQSSLPAGWFKKRPVRAPPSALPRNGRPARAREVPRSGGWIGRRGRRGAIMSGTARTRLCAARQRALSLAARHSSIRLRGPTFGLPPLAS